MLLFFWGHNEQVSIIVEADPEVLGDKRVQSAVEGRFCDSAISVREAALELVGRHIASHPDVGFKVCFNLSSLNGKKEELFSIFIVVMEMLILQLVSALYKFGMLKCSCCFLNLLCCSILRRLQRELKILELVFENEL